MEKTSRVYGLMKLEILRTKIVVKVWNMVQRIVSLRVKGF